jgi:hypothetical protein
VRSFGKPGKISASAAPERQAYNLLLAGVHYLVQLNGQYQGAATGETFNHTGKTDILIRHENKNIFVAECKFWGGYEELIATTTQLLGRELINRT